MFQKQVFAVMPQKNRIWFDIYTGFTMQKRQLGFILKHEGNKEYWKINKSLKKNSFGADFINEMKMILNKFDIYRQILFNK